MATNKEAKVRLFIRAATLASAYLGTIICIFTTVYLIRSVVDAVTLQIVLSMLFIMQLATGLDPATARAVLIDRSAAGEESVGRYDLLLATIIKAIFASPLLAGLWWLSWPTAIFPVWTIGVVIGLCCVGFVTSDIRVMFEARGEYTRGLLAKQGSVSLGMLAVAPALMAGWSIPTAFSLSIAARILFVVPFLHRDGAHLPSTRVDHRVIWRLLASRLWVPIAATSAVAAVGGSIDRVAAFHLLPAATANLYALTYELLSKYWFISYLLAPIMFARTVANQDSHAFRKNALAFLLGTGVVFVVAATAASAIFPMLGIALSRQIAIMHWYDVGMLSAAFATSAVSQVLLADLQARGLAHQVFLISALNVPIACGLFFGLAQHFGLFGLCLAWMLRMGGELVALSMAVARDDDKHDKA